jgi:cytochrome c biogenesis protein CcdA
MLLALDPSGLSLVFTAGALALFSPCGFPMLPGYISYYMGTNASLERVVSGGIACTLGLLTTLCAVGIAVSMLGSLVSRYIPALELVAGVVVISLGLSLIGGIEFPAALTLLKAPKRKGFMGFYLYGITYGLATVSCSGPIFFSIIFTALAGGGPFYSIIVFMAYALGMGIPVIITTVLIAKAKELILKRIILMVPLLQKISGLILVGIGAYLIYSFYVLYY